VAARAVSAQTRHTMGSRFVTCPVCGASVAAALINVHLDSDCARGPAKRQRCGAAAAVQVQQSSQAAALRPVQLSSTEPVAYLRYRGVKAKTPVTSNECLRAAVPCEVRCELA